MKTECRHCDDVNAFLADELSEFERMAFQSHLTECPECQAALKSSRNVIARLRTAPAPATLPDLAPAILHRLHEPAPIPAPVPKRVAWPRIAAIAAIFAILTSTFAAWVLQQRESAPLPTGIAATVTCSARARDWFVRNQEPDGSWSPERWGGQTNYAPALTALPLLALVAAEEPTPDQQAAAHRAASRLLAHQNPDGTFGPDFLGSPYNNAITTLALLETWRKAPGTMPKEKLDAAVAALVRQQTPEGGWGYRFGPMADRSITQWHVQALDLAARLGWSDVRPSTERAIVWLANHTQPLADAQEPPDSTSALLARATTPVELAEDSIDFYQAYFSTAALKREKAPTARQKLATIHEEILRHQATEGAERGSWPPDDQWGRAGGRLYSTALACLSLAGT